MHYICRKKAIAGLLAALPGLLALTGGMLFGVAKILETSTHWEERIIAFTMIAQVIVLFVLGVHVIAWISLFMKRGAMAVGYVATIAGYWIISIGSFMIVGPISAAVSIGGNYSGAWIFALSPIITTAICLGLSMVFFRAIPLRLGVLAAES
jgi:hypothetical protein